MTKPVNDFSSLEVSAVACKLFVSMSRNAIYKSLTIRLLFVSAVSMSLPLLTMVY
jgi:hypothetical protein